MKYSDAFKPLRLGSVLVSFLLLSSCASSPSSPIPPLASRIGGIGGTGITAYGMVQGFGSIFVNGREYFLDDNTQILSNGTPAQEDDLRVGDVVAVEARVDRGSGKALTLQVRNEHQLQGIVEAVDRTAGTLTLLGQTVQAAQLTEVQDSPETVLQRLQPGDAVGVSGFNRGEGWVATRLTHLSGNSASSAAGSFLLRGPVRTVDVRQGTVWIGGQVIPVADPVELRNVQVGQRVVIRGHYRQGKPRADTVRPDRVLPGSGRVEMQGYIYRQPGSGRLVSNGIPLMLGAGPNLRATVESGLQSGVLTHFTGVVSRAGDLLVERIELGQSPTQFMLRGSLRAPSARAMPDDRIENKARPEVQKPQIQRPEVQRPELLRPEVQRPELPRF